METSPEPATGDLRPVRRRLIQSTLLPHRSPDNAVKDEDVLEQEEDEDDEYCGSQNKKNRKRKPKAVSQSRAPRKLAGNGKETRNKKMDEEGSLATVKADFFAKVSERRHQKRQQKEQIPVHSPEENEKACSPSDCLANTTITQKAKRRASATPKKKRANGTPEKQQTNTTPVKDVVNSVPYEACCGQMSDNSPIHCENISQPLPDLWLEAKRTEEENSRIFSGKQIHPFFSSWKTGKRNLERSDLENKWFSIERKNKSTDFSPVHVFEKTQDDSSSVDWRNWTFSDRSSASTSLGPEVACSPIYKGSDDSLQFDKFLNVSPMETSLHQNEGSSSQYPIQLEEISLDHCLMQKEKCPAMSSTFMAAEQVAHCDHLREIEVGCEMDKVGGFSENEDFVLKSDVERQGIFLERMTSTYHDCGNQPKNSLWTSKYQPEKGIEICGNCESVKFLNEWLRLWHEKGSRTSKSSTDNDKWVTQNVDLNYCPSDCDSEDIDEETGLKNVLLVTGPVGSGKSAAIYACAREQGFQVIEVNASDWRSGALVKQRFGEAVESHWLQCSMQNSENKNLLKSFPATFNVKATQGFDNEVTEVIPLSDEEDSNNACGTPEKSFRKENTVVCDQSEIKTLILFEDVDATLYEDRGFIATIQQLAETAKRPMILTSNSDNPVLPNNLDRLEVCFQIPSSKELRSLVYMVCAAEKATIEPCLVERFIDHCQGDIRKTITHLQFWCQGQIHRKDSEVRKTYGPLVFDIDAGHRILPRIIPSGYPSQLSEMIEKEITRSWLMVEKVAGLTEIIEEEEQNNGDSRMHLNEPDSIDAKKDAMLSRHCSDQDGNVFSSQCGTTPELPSPSNSPVAFTRKNVRRKHDAILSSDSEDECLSDGLPGKLVEDMNNEVPVEVNSIFPSHCLANGGCFTSVTEQLPSEGEKLEEDFHDGLPGKLVDDMNNEVPVEVNIISPSHCLPNGGCFTSVTEQLPSEAEKLEEDFHDGLPGKLVEDMNNEVPVEVNIISPSHCLPNGGCFMSVTEQLPSEGEKLEEDFRDGLPGKLVEDMNNEVPVEVNIIFPSHCLANGGCFTSVTEQLPSEGEKLEEDFHPSVTPDYSNVNGMCMPLDVSCVPESSFVPETEIDNGTSSCGHIDDRVEEASTSYNSMPKSTPVEFNNVDSLCGEDKVWIRLCKSFDLNTPPIHGEEVGDSHVEPTEALPREYEMMDECSRIDFCRRAESMQKSVSLKSTDFVQEAWRRLRHCHVDLQQYASLEKKDASQVLELAYGMTDLISEIDLLLSDCQSLTCDYLEPSMVPSEKSHSFSWYDDQLQMASTVAQHGMCLGAKQIVAAESSTNRVDLAWEMLTSSSNTMALGKLISQSKRMIQSLEKGPPQSGIPSKSKLESSLCSTVQSIVPLKSCLSLKGYVFYEYISSLAQIAKSESSRLSESVNTSKRRRRVARNYLSTGALGLSPEEISLLDEYSCHWKVSSKSKDKS